VPTYLSGSIIHAATSCTGLARGLTRTATLMRSREGRAASTSGGRASSPSAYPPSANKGYVLEVSRGPTKQ
jgi:hypothetical protein